MEVVTHENTAANIKVMRPNSSAAPNPNPPNVFKDNNGRGLPDRLRIRQSRYAVIVQAMVSALKDHIIAVAEAK